MNIIVLCTAILILLYLGLSYNVSRVRRKRRGDPSVTDAQLAKAVRAHGNASEYIPLFVVLLLYFNATAAGIVATAIAITITVSRVLHCTGMFLVEDATRAHPLRFLGALGTYVCLLAAGLVVLGQAF